jgi:phosphatidylserine/phosphatidylglycerophosphate/cardiolipin synthase-like enzyme
MVRLCLDVRRAPGDTTRSDAFLRRFAERFIEREWPGSRLPDLYYDPRSLAGNETHRASLHAKCVVVDDERAFIGSANFTEAAQMRNIEVGLLVTDPVIASAAERHIDGLISRGYLLPISSKP